MAERTVKGWWRSLASPANAKYHCYWDDDRSMCGKYTAFLAPADHFHPDPTGHFVDADDSCRVCSRKLSAHLDKQEETSDA